MNSDMHIPLHDTFVWQEKHWFNNAKHELCQVYFHRIHGTIGVHSNEFYELNIVTEGCPQHQINDHIAPAPQGSIFLISPSIQHGYVSSDGAVIFCALIKSLFFERYEGELNRIPGFSFLFEVMPYLRKDSSTALQIQLSDENLEDILPVIRTMLNYSGGNYEGKETVKTAALFFLFTQLSAIASAFSTQNANSQINQNAIEIARSMEYIRRNLSDKLTVDKLASNLCMARSTYLRNFSSVCGCSPIQFLTRCRMAHARKLLCYSNKSITNIAVDCGFYDTSHFIHTFTKHVGNNPSDFRTLFCKKARYDFCTICTPVT